MNRYVYTAYGKATLYDDDWTNPSAPTTDGPLYCGYFFDAESGLYQVRNRYYDAGLSTFISRDPIGLVEAGPNLYRYTDNNAPNRTDPTGLFCIPHNPLPSRPTLRPDNTDPTGEDWLDCMSACIQDNDPLPYALGAAVKGILALGGWQSKSALAAIAKALGNQKLADAIMKTQKLFANQKPVTDLLSLISMGGSGANKAAWKAVQQIGGKVAAVLGPIQIAYGLALAAIETHCMGHCCTASWYGIPYNSTDGNVIKAWKEYYF